ncbi:MAG: hypothetical protein QM809_04320 [Gordonia sp. (in: high G+C Gram-positive bacteria)]|uniref:hypothetical protein n=1 Tax=Gordonia sp. (in: high G+C Gram-positive bacteria) TaxID=84139 RepID=UPI0039E404FC
MDAWRAVERRRGRKLWLGGTVLAVVAVAALVAVFLADHLAPIETAVITAVAVFLLVIVATNGMLDSALPLPDALRRTVVVDDARVVITHRRARSVVFMMPMTVSMIVLVAVMVAVRSPVYVLVIGVFGIAALLDSALSAFRCVISEGTVVLETDHAGVVVRRERAEHIESLSIVEKNSLELWVRGDCSRTWRIFGRQGRAHRSDRFTVPFGAFGGIPLADVAEMIETHAGTEIRV